MIVQGAPVGLVCRDGELPGVDLLPLSLEPVRRELRESQLPIVPTPFIVASQSSPARFVANVRYAKRALPFASLPCGRRAFHAPFASCLIDPVPALRRLATVSIPTFSRSTRVGREWASLRVGLPNAPPPIKQKPRNHGVL